MAAVEKQSYTAVLCFCRKQIEEIGCFDEDRICFLAINKLATQVKAITKKVRGFLRGICGSITGVTVDLKAN